MRLPLIAWLIADVRQKLMHFDRDDLRGLLKFAAVMSFATAFLFVAMNLGNSEGMKKDRGTGRVYWAAGQKLNSSAMTYAVLPLARSVVLTAIVYNRSIWK